MAVNRKLVALLFLGLSLLCARVSARRGGGGMPVWFQCCLAVLWGLILFGLFRQR
jgi:integral membrane sensor domain MASE1